MALRFLLILAFLAILPADSSAQFFGRVSRGYVEMGCDCSYCVRSRGGTYASMVRQARATSAPIPIKDPSAPSPLEVVELALRIADIKPYDLTYDVGSGDGRVLEVAVRDYGCRAVGIEISPAIASAARERLQGVVGLPRRWRVVTGDAEKYDLSKCTVAYLNLYPKILAKIAPKLTGCTRIVSYMHPIPGFDNQRYETEHGPIFLVGWRELAAAAGKEAAVAAAVFVKKPVVSVRVCRT